MDIIYNGTSIVDNVDVLSATISDCAGGQADSLDVSFGNPGKWDVWAPSRGDTIIVTEVDDSISSGLMMVDEIYRNNISVRIRALSVPPEAKRELSKSYRRVLLSQLISDVAAELNMSYVTYGIVDYLYDSVERADETPLGFLQRICSREGYAVKIYDGRIAVFSEHYMEFQGTTDIDIGNDYEFSMVSSGLKSSCRVSYDHPTQGLIDVTASDPTIIGGTIHRVIPVGSVAEAQRFAYGYLRAANKYGQVGVVRRELSSGIGAGSMVSVSDVGNFSGPYLVDRVTHDLIARKSVLYLRAPLEGY